MAAYMFVFLVVFVVVGISPAAGCGTTTHIEISHRAVEYFADSAGTINYRKLLENHTDALMAGSPYPDSFYDDACFGGKYHSESEDTHWAPFLNASVNYIRQHYSQPWDEATEKLVAFLFGIVSHQVADIVWHSLGIDQGFISTMANINFHGVYGQAHSTADLGGDVLTMYELPTDYIPATQGWYIPVDDLFNIYKEYYGTDTKMPADVIQICSTELFIERAAELLALEKLYPEIASKSPFLLDQFENYFLGGLEDMVGWTARLWEETVTMLDKGTGICDIPKSTLFIDCHPSSRPHARGNRYPDKNGYYTRQPRHGLSQADVTVERYLRGIRIKPKQSLLDKMYAIQKSHTLKRNPNKSNVNAGNVRQPDRKLFVNNAYAKLGWAYATGDLNFDGNEDLVVSAPGYGSYEYNSSPQEGRVYIIYGDGDGIPSGISNLDQLESVSPKQGQIVKGWGTAQFRYGSAISVVDINLDGAEDLIIGVPAFTVDGTPLEYHGAVMIYFGIPAKHEVARGAANITITCEKTHYCNLGFSLGVGDVNQDGHPDLIIGAPFAAAGGQQRGFIAAYIASKNNFGYQYFDVEKLTWQKQGHQDYGWFGYNILTHKKFGRELLLVSQPEYRKCFNANCSLSPNDTQSTGRTYMYDLGPNPSPDTVFEGKHQFDQMGWSCDVGMPFVDHSYMLACAGVGEKVQGSLAGIPFSFSQAGQVHLTNITGAPWPSDRVLFSGDRQYGRFGSKLKFLDLNSDNYDDLLIGAAYRSDDITEEILPGEDGQVFVYFGGQKFPLGNATLDCGNSIVVPCPQYSGSLTLVWSDTTATERSRFGSNLILLKSKNRKQLFATAEHSSEFARLAGAVGVFDF